LPGTQEARQVPDRTPKSASTGPLEAGRRWAAEQSRRLRPAARAGRRWAYERSRRVIPAARAAPATIAVRAKAIGRKVGHEVAHPSKKTIRRGSVVLLLAVAVAVFIAVFDWNWFRGPVGRYASLRTGREVRLEGNLKVKPFSWTPQATVDRLTIGHPRWMKTGHTAEVQRLTVRVKLVPLMMGRVELPLVDLDHPNFDLLRDAQGRANWKLDAKSKRPTRLPPINNFIIRDGHIRFVDEKKHLTVIGTVQSSESTVTQGEGFRLTGKGTVNTNPFTLKVTGGPLINVHRNQPYRFDAEIHAGATHATAKGAIPKPFDFGRVDADVTLAGDDLARLYDLTGASLPNTPPYRLSGRFERRGEVYNFPSFRGRVGDSDLGGSVKADNSHDRPMITADLVSRSLDFDDMATIFGGPPSVGRGETASPEQVAMAHKLRAEGRILPEATLDTRRLRAADADVKFRATAVRAGRLPLRQVGFHLTLDHALLNVDDMAFDFPRGRITGNVRLNGRGAVPVTDLDLRLSRIGLEYLVPPVRGSVPLAGALSGRAKLHGVGNSVRKAAASSNGSVAVVVPQGQIREAFAELMGINVAPGLFQLLSKDQDKTNLRCAVGQFDVSGGVARARRIVIDTKPVLVEGQGQVSFVNETIDVRLKGKNKKVRILHVMAPIRVTGRLNHVQVKPELIKAAPQVGIAAILGAVVSPLAAILPFIDPGLAKDANCSALVAGG
jgi:uncharacterized protein involved in outer membrane biogenesis